MSPLVWTRSAALVALLLLGCSGPTLVDAPPEFPPISAGWGAILGQAPADADVLVVASLDQLAAQDVSEVLSAAAWAKEWSTQLGDILGVDLSHYGVFHQLGLRLGGGAGVFLYDSAWVGVADLENRSLLEVLIEDIDLRNPDLVVDRSEHELGDLFTVTAFGDGDPASWILLTDAQVIVTLPGSTTPRAEDAYETLASVALGGWPQNARYNPLVLEALAHFGVDAWALGYAETGPTLNLLAGEASSADEDALCAASSDAIVAAVPYVLLGINRETADLRPEVGESRRQRFHLAVAEEYQQAAHGLLRPSPVDPVDLREGVIAAGFLHVDAEALSTGFPQWAPARTCPDPISTLGWIGYVAQYLKSTPEPLSGFALGALFDLRTTGGVPFIDAYVELSSVQPTTLSVLLQSALEDQLGATGTPDTWASIPVIRYRVGLLYRLTLYHGAHALGLSLGRVDERWFETVMDLSQTRSDEFLHLVINGPRLVELFEMAMGFAGVAADDPDAVATQEALFAEERAELEELIELTVSATYRNGFVRVDSVTLRR